MPALATMAASRAQSADLPTLKSVTYRFEDLPSRPSGQNVSHAIFDGLTHSGFRIEAHEPHPPHHHAREEMTMIGNESSNGMSPQVHNPGRSSLGDSGSDRRVPDAEMVHQPLRDDMFVAQAERAATEQAHPLGSSDAHPASVVSCTVLHPSNGQIHFREPSTSVSTIACPS